MDNQANYAEREHYRKLTRGISDTIVEKNARNHCKG